MEPDWPAPANVHALITTRAGGVSRGPYGAPPEGRGGMNIGLGSGDNLADVTANRARLRTALPADPRWLNQVHGAVVVDAARVDSNAMADASFTDAANVVCAVSIADCMPVLLTDASGCAVGVAHACHANAVQHLPGRWPRCAFRWPPTGSGRLLDRPGGAGVDVEDELACGRCRIRILV